MLTKQVFESILETLKINQAKELNFKEAKLNREQIVQLIEALKNNTSLRVLTLSFNHITDKDVEGLAKILETNQTLKILRLGYNQISHHGAKHLANALQKNNSLLELNLGANEIGDTGVIHLVTSIKANTHCSLRSLDLFHNNISDLGAYFLLDMLKGNGSLHDIFLSANLINSSTSVREQLESNLYRNRKAYQSTVDANYPVNNSDDEKKNRWFALEATALTETRTPALNSENSSNRSLFFQDKSTQTEALPEPSILKNVNQLHFCRWGK